MSISQGFGDVRSQARQGVAGDWAMSSHLNRSASALNSSPQTSQIGTVVVGAATNDKVYTVTINSVAVSYTSDGSATVAEIADGLALAVNAEPLVRGQVGAVSDAVDTVTLTGLTPGVVFTATDADAQLTTTAATTAAASAAAVAFGRMLVSTGYQSGEAERLVAVADDNRFTPQVITITPSGYVAAALLTCRVYEVRGAERIVIGEYTETSATDLNATLDALVVGINAALPANSVLAASTPATATALTFTAEVGGLEIEVELSADDSGASTPTSAKAYTTGPTIATSLARALAGMSLYSPSDEAAAVAGTVGQYAANAGVKYAQAGALWVESDESPAEGADVYVELAVGATAGRLYAADSATRVALSRATARWERDGLVTADSLAAVRIAV